MIIFDYKYRFKYLLSSTLSCWLIFVIKKCVSICASMESNESLAKFYWFFHKKRSYIYVYVHVYV